MRSRAIAIVLLTALLGVVLAHPMAQGRRPGKISPGLRARVASGARVPVIIELRAQPDDAPDLPRAHAIARGIARAQDGFLLRTPGYGHIKRLTSLPIVAIEVDERVLADLDADPDVVSVALDEPRRPSLMQSVPLVGAPGAWSLGASGTGWSIAVLDTGVDKNHPFLAGKVVSEACYGTNSAAASSSCPGGEDTTQVDSGVPCADYVHGCDHGTHIAGIAAGHHGSLSGVARDASIIAVKVFSNIFDEDFCFPVGPPCAGAFDSDILAGLDRVYELQTEFDIAAVNLSLGGGDYAGSCDADEPAYKTAIDLLRSVGIATVISSGNTGSKSTMEAPACISSAVAVGASTKTNLFAAFTSRSPLLKLLAPGTNIYSSVPGGGYATFSGTSMAAPHVAGAWAVLKSRMPTASVTDVETALTSTGLPIADAANARTWPRIRVGAAVTSMPLGPPIVTGLIASPALPQPANVPITWTARAVGGTGTLQYKFWLYAGETDTWTLLRDYSTTRSVVWTPTIPGTYAVRVWTRTLGSSADFDAELSSGNFSIDSESPTLLSVTADHVPPLYANVPVTWTAHVRGGTGPLEYQFWRMDSATNTWVIVQEYSPANTFTWTPSPTDSGSVQLQVWVRAIGSGAPYEASLISETFDLLGKTNFTLNSQPGDYIGLGQHIVRTSIGATMNLSTQFGEGAYIFYQTFTPSYSSWSFNFGAPGGQVLTPGVYEQATRWPFQLSTVPGLDVSGDGRGCNMLTGRYVVLEVERVNDQYTRFAADFEQHCEGGSVPLFGSVRFNSVVPPSERPVAIQSLKRSGTLSAKVGVPMTWTATAIGGGPPLQYKFLLYTKATNTTTIVHDGPANALVWTPPRVGTYKVQVWVRSTGSQAPYEASAGSAEFTVMAGPVPGVSLIASPVSPQPANVPITWTAHAEGVTGPFEYKFWVYAPATDTWTLLRDYSTAQSFIWTPTIPGTYAVRVWVRKVGSTAAFEGYQSSGDFSIVSEHPVMQSVTADHVSPLFANVPVTWTANVRGGTGPLEYQFWRIDSQTNTSTMVQDYSPANTFTWTPSPTDSGAFQLEVRARAIGSPYASETSNYSGLFALLGTTNFILNSQPGDYIGGGQRVARGNFRANMTLEPAAEVAFISYETAFPVYGAWYFHFVAPDRQALIPGVYDNATRWFFGTTVPGLGVQVADGTGSRDCNTLTGRFVVLDVERVNDQYTRIAADFEQHCNGAAAALFGSVRFNSTIPPSERPVAIQSLKPSPALPAKVGVPTTWTAATIGGGAPLQYKFLLYSKATKHHHRRPGRPCECARLDAAARGCLQGAGLGPEYWLTSAVRGIG
jgi:subtilisin family serine protease